jgi:hypothetical protein
MNHFLNKIPVELTAMHVIGLPITPISYGKR